MQSSAGSLCHLCAAELQPQLWDCSRASVLGAAAVAGQGISVLHAAASDGAGDSVKGREFSVTCCS